MYTALGRVLTILLMVLVVIAPFAAPALADTYTFNVTSGDWDIDTNWHPTDGPPDGDDTAIIPNGKTCIVASDHQRAELIDVQSGGTLVIDGKDLTLPAAASSSVNQLINGTLQFKNSGRIVCETEDEYYTLRLSGAGSINASDASTLGPGSIVTASTNNYDADVLIDDNLTVKGSVTFDIVGVLYVDGALIVDDAHDVMNVGAAPPGNATGLISGEGLLQCSAGLLRVRRMHLEGGFAGTIHATGGNTVAGRIHFSEYGVAHFTVYGYILVDSGGTLEIASWLFEHLAGGCFSVTGGTIKLNEDAHAWFNFSG